RGDSVVKFANHPSYEHLIRKEINWYEITKQLGLGEYRPNLNSFSHNTMDLQYLKGFKPVYKKLLEANQDNKIFILINIFNTIKEFHKIKREIPKRVLLDDIKIEFYDKVFTRVNSINNLILDFNEDEFREVVAKAYK